VRSSSESAMYSIFISSAIGSSLDSVNERATKNDQRGPSQNGSGRVVAASTL